MITKTLTIIDPIGIHARPASYIINEVKKFQSEMFIHYNNKQANLNSILSIMSLGILSGSKIKITAEGSDENKALNHIIAVMQKQKMIA